MMNALDEGLSLQSSHSSNHPGGAAGTLAAQQIPEILVVGLAECRMELACLVLI